MDNSESESKEKEDNFIQNLSFTESPQDNNIKSTIFQNKPQDKNLITRDTYKSQNPKQMNRRSLTPIMGNFLLNQIGYIKKDNKFESKKNITEEKRKFRKFSSPNIKDFVSNLLVNGDSKNNNEEEGDNKDNKKDDIKKAEIINKMKLKGRRNSLRVKKKKKAFSITQSNLDKITENSNENNLDAEKALEIFNTINNGNFDLKQSAKMRYSLSFGGVDEEDNEESSNDDNNNDSSYISKIESKQVSMYDIDEDLKELKEIGNNLKSPVIRQARTTYKENKLISSFNINNNNDNVDDNDNNQGSILFQLKKMSTRTDNQNKINKINHNPIVFDDKLELSFHEDLNKKPSKASISDSNLISYKNDTNFITKLNYVNEKVLSVSMVENLKNNFFGFSYKNDTDIIKKINFGYMMDIDIIDSKRKKIDNIHNSHNSHESLNNNNDSLINLVNENSNFTSNFNENSEKENDVKKITYNKSKKYKKKEDVSPIKNKSKNKNNQKYAKENIETIFIEEKKNKNNNFRKNNYLINNTKELNKLIKDKLNTLSKRNFNPINLITNRNREINRISLEFTNLPHNKKNNYLFMSRENNISCLGTENSNNITYNRYYNGNNITMNNYFNNNNSYRLNHLTNANTISRDNNKDIYTNEKESEENDSVLSNSTKSYYNRNSNAIAAVKNKLAMKLKEEIKKSKIFYNLEKNDYNYLNKNENQKYHRVSSLENIRVKNFLKKHYYMDDIGNSDRGYYLMKTLSKSPSVITYTNLKTKFEENENNNEYNGIARQLSNILNISNMNYQINCSNKLNQIKEEPIINSNNKNKKDESKSMNNKNNKKSKSNIKIKSMCASEERRFINNNNNNNNKNKSKDIDKKKSKQALITKEFKLNNPINKSKDVVMRNHKNNLSIKNKTCVNKNNKNYSNNKNNSIQNKTFYYNPTIKRNKEFSINKDNKMTKVTNKGISSYKNHEENKNINKNISRDKLDKSFIIKNKVGYYRNNRLEVENHSFLTNCHNSRTNINLKEYNDLISRVEIKNNKTKSKINFKNKKISNKGEVKKNCINKDKINNK